jgi:hypothetical protein
VLMSTRKPFGVSDTPAPTWLPADWLRWGRLALWWGESVLVADCHSAGLAT